MAEILIYKFGGSCLKGQSDIEAIARRISEAGDSKVVVVASALHGITDRILERLGRDDADSIEPFVTSVEMTHLEFSPTLVEPPFVSIFNEAKNRLLNAMHSHHGKREESSMADALSCGERMSSVAIAAALTEFGIDAAPAWAERIGIHLDSSSEQPQIDLERTAEALTLPAAEVPVVTGWYGLSEGGVSEDVVSAGGVSAGFVSEGGVSLLGRGGSDLTATSLAAILNAEEVTIWRDVPGVLALAPRWSLPSRNLPYLSYTEASELALFSEPMLHHLAVEPLRSRGIPLRLRPLHDPTSLGSCIGPKVSAGPPEVRAVGCLPRLVTLTMRLSGVVSVAKVVADATAVLERSQTRVWSLRAQPGEATFLVSERDAARAVRQLSEFPSLPTPECGAPVALLCLVGEGIGSDESVGRRIFGLSEANDLLLTPLDEGKRDHALHFTVPAERTHDALAALASELDLLSA
jgi:aspartokinase